MGEREQQLEDNLSEAIYTKDSKEEAEVRRKLAAEGFKEKVGYSIHNADMQRSIDEMERQKREARENKQKVIVLHSLDNIGTSLWIKE